MPLLYYTISLLSRYTTASYEYRQSTTGLDAYLWAYAEWLQWLYPSTNIKYLPRSGIVVCSA